MELRLCERHTARTEAVKELRDTGAARGTRKLRGKTHAHLTCTAFFCATVGGVAPGEQHA